MGGLNHKRRRYRARGWGVDQIPEDDEPHVFEGTPPGRSRFRSQSAARWRRGGRRRARRRARWL